MRSDLALALVAALALGQPALGQSDAPLTLNWLYGVPVQEAAGRLFDGGGEVFIERLPKAPSPDAIVSGPDFLSKPKKISPAVCAFSVVSVHFDRLGAAQAPEDQRQALAKSHYAELPLRVRSVERSSRYFAPENAAPSGACGGSPPATNTFQSTSSETAIVAVANLQSVMSASRRAGPLPFRFVHTCDQQQKRCAGGRQALARLDLGMIESITEGRQCPDRAGRVVARSQRRCFEIDFAEGGEAAAGAHWWVELVLQRDKVVEASLGSVVNPLVEGPGFFRR